MAAKLLPQRSTTEGFDDDGRTNRTGTVRTASAHIITAVIGSGVLTLPWAMAQLGWLAGITALLMFCIITWFCTTLQADCYRYPDPVTGARNYTYMDAVRSNLGGVNVQMCGLVQNMKFVGVAIGYVITASLSIAAVKRSNCFHKNGHEAACTEPISAYMMIFAAMEIVLSQLPNFHKIWWLSYIAAATSFAYASIGVGLTIAKIAEDGLARTSITGVEIGVDVSGSEKVWRTFQALGNIAVAYSFALILIEIQVFNQPLFQFVENWSRKQWPDQIFLMAEHTITIPLWGNFTVSFFRVIWRTLYVILTTMVAMMFPFFNSFLGLLGALGFWPLTVYFPVEMYISQAAIQRFSVVWIMLRLLSLACLLVSLAAACGSIQGIVSQLIGQSSLKFRGQTELQPTWKEYLWLLS